MRRKPATNSAKPQGNGKLVDGAWRARGNGNWGLGRSRQWAPGAVRISAELSS
ncbi:MAG: hypothetical protein ABR519_03150 [Bacteroidales bacterium]